MNNENNSFNDLMSDVNKILDSKFEKPIKKITNMLPSNDIEPTEVKQKKEKELDANLDYNKNLDELTDFIISFFKETESILLQLGSGNIGIYLAKSFLKLGVIITKIAKIYSHKQFKLNGLDKSLFVNLHRRFFTFNRTFLINSLSKNLDQKHYLTKKLNNK